MNNNPFEDKILDGGKCICDICGKTKKMGGLFDPKSPAPKIVCVDCMVRTTAEDHDLTIKEAKHHRKRMFASSNLFIKLKMEDYSKLKGEEVESIEEANMILNPIMDYWNNKLTIKQRKAFEQMNDEELEKAYRKITIDFSSLLKKNKSNGIKIGRNAPCPCGSGKKYKKCCGNNN